jgi:hypothetical protein
VARRACGPARGNKETHGSRHRADELNAFDLDIQGGHLRDREQGARLEIADKMHAGRPTFISMVVGRRIRAASFDGPNAIG